LVKGQAAHSVAASYVESDGFQEGTDYEVWSVWGSSVVESGSAGVRVSVGHTDKDFGARDFYAPYPSREKTSATVVDVAPRIALGGEWWLRCIARYRRHEDEFILTAEDPSYYRNRHTTDSFIERATLTSPRYGLGMTAVGVERSDARLESSSLGDREADTTSAFLEHRLPGEGYTADLGVRLDHHSRWGTEVSPSVALSVPVCSWASWRASVARGIRPPSFTELYYRDPYNEGNSELEPEEAWGGETGFDLKPWEHGRVGVTYFVRDTENLIDWTRSSSDEPWRASNIGEATFEGGEITLTETWGLFDWTGRYRYTDVDAEAGEAESKYALNVARHEMGVGVGLRETRGFSASVDGSCRDVPTLDSYWLVGAGIAQRIGRVVVFGRGKNLLDEDYEEIPGVPTAGRYVEAGAELVW
jgi:iron complex outermembrane receptor protein